MRRRSLRLASMLVVFLARIYGFGTVRWPKTKVSLTISDGEPLALTLFSPAQHYAMLRA
jgi:hypothetical protein